MHECLKTSIDQYEQLIDHARTLDSLLQDGDPQRLREYVAKLNELQKVAGYHDRQLLVEMAGSSVDWQVNHQIQKRQHLLQQLVAMNQLILPKIHGMMSVTAADLAHLKEGRAAVSGYHQPIARSPRSSRGVG